MKLSRTLLALLPALTLTASPCLAGDNSAAAITEGEITDHVGYLASDALEGRGTGTQGERLAGEYIATAFQRYGLEPGAADGTFFQPFGVADGARVKGEPQLSIQVGRWDRELKSGSDFNPFGFSSSSSGAPLPLVFAGYGITDPERGYDDYAGLDVKGKAVLILRYQPRENEGVGSHSHFATKAANAKKHGASALLVVTGPLNHPDDDSLVPFGRAGGSEQGLAAAHVEQSVVEGLFRMIGKDLERVQEGIDDAQKPNSFPIDARLSFELTIEREHLQARNVIGVIRGTDPALSKQPLVIGAHYDHLGHGGPGSLAPRARGQIHNGADDNASGTSGLLELAQAFSVAPPKRTVYFVAFSGEERGLLGSAQFVRDSPIPVESIAAMINLDMIGRLTKETVEVGGVDTAPTFREIVADAIEAEGLKATYTGTGFGPSDHQSFYQAKVPVLFFFTGLHSDYHRPTDDADLVDSAGAARVTRVAYACASRLANSDERPEYAAIAPERGRRGRGPRLGVRLDQAHQGPGAAIAAVMPDTLAEKAGIKSGDVIVELGEHEVGTLQDLISALGNQRGGETKVVVRRGGEELVLTVTFPARRDPPAAAEEQEEEKATPTPTLSKEKLDAIRERLRQKRKASGGD